MTISLQHTETGTMIVLNGRLDSVTSPRAQTELEQHMENLSGPVTLHCAELHYLSSAGLRVLLSLSKRSQNSLRLIGLSGTVREVIEISGFGCILETK